MMPYLISAAVMLAGAARQQRHTATMQALQHRFQTELARFSEENAQLREEMDAHSRQMRNMVANTAHDLKTVSASHYCLLFSLSFLVVFLYHISLYSRLQQSHQDVT
jgi:uncharacterized membrane protein